MITYSPLGSEITVNTTYARSQSHADTALLADGRLVVSWLDYQPGTSVGKYVRLQLLEADGTPAGGEVTVTGPLNGAGQPTVTGLAGGGYVVAWDGSGGTKAQVYDSAGAPVGGEVTLVANWGGNHPDITALADGGFAVAWEDERTVGGDVSGSGVHLRTFDASGVATSPDLLVNTTTPGDQCMVSVAALAGGNRVVTWFDDAVGAAPNAMRAQIFDAAGVRVGGEITVSGAGTFVGEATAPVTALANGNFAIAWHQSDAAYALSHRVQIFSASGERLGGEIAAPPGSGSETGPALAALTDGSLALAWVGYDGSGMGRGVLVQVFDAGGTAFGEPAVVNTQTNGDQTDPALVALADGGFAITWIDRNGAGADDDEVRMQLFARSGTLDPVTIGSDGGGDTAALALDENGLAVTQVAASGGLGALAYAIAGGADAARFAIDAATGALSFADAPDFEAPADADGDNVYEVVVAASDGVRSDTQALAVSVTGLDEALVITSNGGGATAAVELDEGTTAVATVVAV
ncbi:MAG TPA: cadherin repeat domain-containing protein, partial [Croceibacterium sp.]